MKTTGKVLDKWGKAQVWWVLLVRIDEESFWRSDYPVRYFEVLSGLNKGYVYGILQYEPDPHINSKIGANQVIYQLERRIKGKYHQKIGDTVWDGLEYVSDVFVDPKTFLTFGEVETGIKSVIEAANQLIGDCRELSESEAGRWKSGPPLVFGPSSNKVGQETYTFMLDQELDQFFGQALMSGESIERKKTMENFLSLLFPLRVNEFPRPLAQLSGIPKKRLETDEGLNLLRAIGDAGEAFFDFLVGYLSSWLMDCWLAKGLILSIFPLDNVVQFSLSRSISNGKFVQPLSHTDGVSPIATTALEIKELLLKHLPEARENSPSFEEIRSRFYPEHRSLEIQRMEIGGKAKQSLHDSDHRLLLDETLAHMNFYDRCAEFLAEQRAGLVLMPIGVATLIC